MVQIDLENKNATKEGEKEGEREMKEAITFNETLKEWSLLI